MRLHRTIHLASSVLACLVFAGCSFSAHAGSTSVKEPKHHHDEHANRTPKKREATTPKESTSKETKSKETPAKTTDSSAATETPLKAGMSRLIVPVTVSLAAVNEKLEEDLPTTEARDWKRVTKKGKKYEVDVRYEVWRDPIKVSMHGDKLRVTVPLRYASDFRAKVDKPLGKGSLWLTHGESWGTKEHQQHLDVTLDLSLSVSEDYTLQSNTKLVSMKHGSPPSGNACAKAGVKICVPKKDLASYVEDEMNEHLGKKIEAALKKGDEKVGTLFDLKKRVQSLWVGIATPVELQKPKQVNCPTVVGEACAKSAWLAFAPSSLGLSPLELRGDSLGVRVALEGKLSLTEARPSTNSPELPKLQSTTGGTAFELATAFDISIVHVTAQLNKAMAATPIHIGSASLKLKAASISVTDGAKKAVALEIVTEKDQRLGFAATLEYDLTKKLFRLANLVPSAATRALLERELKELNPAELEKAIVEHATLALDGASAALREAIATALSSALPGKLRVNGTLSEIALEDFSLSEKAISARVVLKGPLGVEFVP